MRTVHLIVNNFFNNLLLIEMDVKELLPPEALDELDSRIQDTFEELKALGDLDVVQEVPFTLGPLIAYPRRPRTARQHSANAVGAAKEQRRAGTS